MKPATEIRVLHVDDDQSFLEVSKTILSEEGPFCIETATSVQEALSKWSEHRFDVIVSDYEMPQQNGLDFLKMVREKGAEIPFILFTGKGREEIVVQALNLGADRYINKQGDPQTVYKELSVSIRQLYEKTQAEKMLWESEERFERMVTNSKDLVMLTQTDGIILYMSPSCKNILGYEPEELVGKNPWVIHPDDSERVKKIFQTALTSKLSGTAEYRIITKQGETRWLNHSFSQIIENGKIKQIVSTLKDITESKQMENQLKTLEERWHFALDSAGDGVWDWNPQTNEVFLSKRWKQMLGYEENEIRNNFKEWLTRLHPEDKSKVFEEMQKHFTRKTPYYINEHRLLSKDGSYKWLLSRGKVISWTSDGKPLRVIGTHTDITESKKFNDALRESEEKFSAAFNSSGAALAVTRLNDGLFVEVNDCFLKIFGYTRQEVIGKTAGQLHLYADMKERDEIVQLALNNQPVINREVIALKKDATEFTVLFSTKIVNIKNQMHLLTTLIDVSELKKTQKALFQRQKELENFIEMAPDAVTIVNTEGKIIECNESTWKNFGIAKKEDVLGRRVIDFVAEQDREKVLQSIQNALKGQTVKNVILTGKGGVNGQEFTLESSAKAIFDTAGRPTAIVSIIRDITQRNKDHEKLDHALAQAELLLEKLSVVGGFVRHDIRNKLAVITSTLYLCRKYSKNDQQVLKYLEQINDTTENIRNILEFAQTYEAVGSQGLSWIQVHKAIDEAQSLFSGLKDVQIDVANMDFEVLADSALVEIFHNLIDNSIKYANAQDVIKINIKAGPDEKGNLQLIYEDNGQGIDAKIRPLLFNKGVGNSTGLGLYLIQRICDIYGWAVQENGEVGKGVRFVLSIPKELSRTK